MSRFLELITGGRVFESDEPPSGGSVESPVAPDVDPDVEDEQFIPRSELEQANSTWEGRVRTAQQESHTARQSIESQLAMAGLALDANNNIVAANSAPTPVVGMPQQLNPTQDMTGVLTQFEENYGITATDMQTLVSGIARETIAPYAEALERVVQTTGSLAEQQALASLPGVDEQVTAEIRATLQQAGINPALASKQQMEQAYYMAMGKRRVAEMQGTAPVVPVVAPGQTREELIAGAGTAAGGAPPASSAAGDTALLRMYNNTPQDLASRGMTIDDLRNPRIGGHSA